MIPSLAAVAKLAAVLGAASGGVLVQQHWF
jgi:hypothetical protein